MARVPKVALWLKFQVTQKYFILSLVKKIHSEQNYLLFVKNKVINYKSLNLNASRHNILYFEKNDSFEINLIFALTYIGSM